MERMLAVVAAVDTVDTVGTVADIAAGHVLLLPSVDSVLRLQAVVGSFRGARSSPVLLELLGCMVLG